MGKTRVELNSAGIQAVLKSAEMQAILTEQANRISGESEIYIAGTRAVAEVRGDDGNNGLLKKMGKKS